MANHLLNVCRSGASKFESLQEQLIENVFVQNDYDIGKVLQDKKNTGQCNYLRKNHKNHVKTLLMNGML